MAVLTVSSKGLDHLPLIAANESDPRVSTPIPAAIRRFFVFIKYGLIK